VRDVLKNGGDVSQFLPEVVQRDMEGRFWDWKRFKAFQPY
jgi:phosphopantetheine adenylyltransferase